MKIGQKVIVRCPVYYNGRKFTGIITWINKDNAQCKVIIEGNTRSKLFANCWIFPTSSMLVI